MKNIDLTILIPCRDEEEVISKTLDILAEHLKNIIYEIIIIDDFSGDKTYLIVDQYSKKNEKIKIFKNKNIGLGGAINLGIEKAIGNYLAIFMADLSDSPDDLIRYFNEIKYSELDAIFGSRFFRESKIKDYPKICWQRV